MNTILFDIDGTLIRSGGAGMIAIAEAMKRLFDVDSIAEVKVHGRTDNGIFSDIFDGLALSYDEHRARFDEAYWELLPEKLKLCDGAILPGVVELLDELSAIENVTLGVLTGNSRQAAEAKLEHFGLDKYFSFGGFGDIYSDRNDVAVLARKSAEEFLGPRFSEKKLWVVGDTPNDIACARFIESRVVAVETGGCSPAVLRAAAPDLQLACLTNRLAFVSTVVG